MNLRSKTSTRHEKKILQLSKSHKEKRRSNPISKKSSTVKKSTPRKSVAIGSIFNFEDSLFVTGLDSQSRVVTPLQLRKNPIDPKHNMAAQAANDLNGQFGGGGPGQPEGNDEMMRQLLAQMQNLNAMVRENQQQNQANAEAIQNLAANNNNPQPQVPPVQPPNNNQPPNGQQPNQPPIQHPPAQQPPAQQPPVQQPNNLPTQDPSLFNLPNIQAPANSNKQVSSFSSVEALTHMLRKMSSEFEGANNFSLAHVAVFISGLIEHKVLSFNSGTEEAMLTIFRKLRDYIENMEKRKNQELQLRQTTFEAQNSLNFFDVLVSTWLRDLLPRSPSNSSEQPFRSGMQKSNQIQRAGFCMQYNHSGVCTRMERYGKPCTYSHICSFPGCGGSHPEKFCELKNNRSSNARPSFIQSMQQQQVLGGQAMPNMQPAYNQNNMGNATNNSGFQNNFQQAQNQQRSSQNNLFGFQ